MKALKGKIAVAARKAKRRVENPLTEAQKNKMVAAEVERQRKILRAAVEKNKKSRVERRQEARHGLES
jgi:hypothetical protein